MIISKHLRLDYNPIVIYPIICVLGGIVSMIGDLAASAIKRNFDIKDYGTLIPGHGGILDRFDSIIIVAPIVYLVIVMLTGATL
jgi:phosphatidate cytidylyltransferase